MDLEAIGGLVAEESHCIAALDQGQPLGNELLELDGTDAAWLAARGEEAGVAIVPGPGFFPSGSDLGRSSARLAFSYETPARIAEGTELLASLR